MPTVELGIGKVESPVKRGGEGGKNRIRRWFLAEDFFGINVDVGLAREDGPGEDEFVFAASAFDSFFGIGGVGDDHAGVGVVGDVSNVHFIGVVQVWEDGGWVGEAELPG